MNEFIIEQTAKALIAEHGPGPVYNYKTIAKILAKQESTLLQLKCEKRLRLPIVEYGNRSWGATVYAVAAYLNGAFSEDVTPKPPRPSKSLQDPPSHTKSLKPSKSARPAKSAKTSKLEEDWTDLWAARSRAAFELRVFEELTGLEKTKKAT